jgi:hypothetical protein
VFQSRFAAVASTAQWCDAAAGGNQLPRDSIFNSNRNATAL